MLSSAEWHHYWDSTKESQALTRSLSHTVLLPPSFTHSRLNPETKQEPDHVVINHPRGKCLIVPIRWGKSWDLNHEIGGNCLMVASHWGESWVEQWNWWELSGCYKVPRLQGYQTSKVINWWDETKIVALLYLAINPWGHALWTIFGYRLTIKLLHTTKAWIWLLRGMLFGSASGYKLKICVKPCMSMDMAPAWQFQSTFWR